jgi:hypothetical protein
MVLIALVPSCRARITWNANAVCLALVQGSITVQFPSAYSANFPADVIAHDEQDVGLGLLGRRRRARCRQGNEQSQQAEAERPHEAHVGLLLAEAARHGRQPAPAMQPRRLHRNMKVPVKERRASCVRGVAFVTPEGWG